jgi:hypothetical protein
MATDHWSGIFAEARDRTGGDESMPEPNHSGNYDHIRCKTCGAAWLPGVNKLTGEMEPGHSETSYCNRYRPTDLAPPWVAEALSQHERVRDAVCATASNLPAVADDALKARREVTGGVPTREWPENGKPTPGGDVHA